MSLTHTAAEMRTANVEAAGVVIQPSLRWQDDSRSPLWAQTVILAALFALAIFLQLLNGAFGSEFNAYPDEPAHYVTSLMLREYVTGPHPLSPIKFAEQYYYHYPKVAFGHWPPVFYVIQAAWMLLFSASRASVRLEIAFTTAVLAFSLWREARRWFGNTWALLASVLLVCVPLIQNSTDEEMAEILLVLFCFWSTVYFSRYLESGAQSDSVWFGTYFSLAVLTKGSGWLLVLLPPIALLLTRKLHCLLRRSFWYGIVLIALLCLPWQLITLHSAAQGWTGGSQPSVNYTMTALGQFLGLLISILGPVLSILVVLGIVVQVIVPMFSRPVAAVPSAMLGLILADWIFHAVIPAGVEDRKMIIAVPAMIYFLFAGGIWLADHIPFGANLVRWRRPVVAVIAAFAFATTAFTIPRASHFGYREAARFIVSDPSLRNARLIVSSGSIGEGLLISEIAMREPRPRDTILRATKQLAHVDWAGTNYRSLYKTPAELLRYLRVAHIAGVVLDDYPDESAFPHQQLVERTIKENPAAFQLLAVCPGRAQGKPGEVKVYRILPATARQQF